MLMKNKKTENLNIEFVNYTTTKKHNNSNNNNTQTKPNSVSRESAISESIT